MHSNYTESKINVVAKSEPFFGHHLHQFILLRTTHHGMGKMSKIRRG
jgi:hypothetical protein